MRTVTVVDDSELTDRGGNLAAFFEASNGSYHTWIIGESVDFEGEDDHPDLVQLDKDLCGLGLEDGTHVLISISW